MTEQDAGRVVAIIITCIVMVLLIVLLIFNEIETGRKLDAVCKDAGYEEHTDAEFTHQKSFKIECDGQDIVNAYRSVRCVKWDKWDKCIKSKEHIELESPFLPW